MMTFPEITDAITSAVGEAARMKPLPHDCDNNEAHLTPFFTTPANSATVVIGQVRIDL
jgi:hypothetical protein